MKILRTFFFIALFALFAWPSFPAFAQTTSTSDSTANSFFAPEGATTTDPSEEALQGGDGLMSCFDYYHFGSVTASLNSKAQAVLPGDIAVFSGLLLNENTYPVVDTAIYVKIFRVQTNSSAQHLNGDFLVDQFLSEGTFNLGAGESHPIELTWHSPTTLVPGQYRIVTYVASAQRFNLSGLSFTDDVIGSSQTFDVASGSETTLPVEWDKNAVAVNGTAYAFAHPIPKFSQDTATVITAPLVNPTDTAEEVTLTWTAYNWDGLLEQNRIETKNQTVTLKAHETKTVSYTTPTSPGPVTFVVALAQANGGKSFIDVRLAHDGASQARINFPALTAFPLAKGQKFDMFSCLHSVSPESIPEGTLTLKLLDENGTEVASSTYEGPITGNMMGFHKALVAPEDMRKATLLATLSYGGKAEQVAMSYDCDTLGSAACAGTGHGFWFMHRVTIGLIILLLLILIGVAIFLRQRKNTDMSRLRSTLPTALLVFVMFGIGAFLAPTSAHAASATWTNSSPYTTTPFTVAAGGGNSSVSIIDAYVDVTYFSNSSVPEGASVNKGDTITFTLPKNNTDIDWYGTGTFSDSPYGYWRTTFPAPLLGKCDQDDFLDVGPSRNGGIYGQAIVTRPTATITASGMTCTGSDPTFTCTVTASSGAISAIVHFPATTGGLRAQDQQIPCGGDAATCEQMGRDGAMATPPTVRHLGFLENLFTSFTPKALAEIAFPTKYECPSSSPVAISVAAQTITHNFTVGSASKPNLTAGSISPTTASVGTAKTFTATISNTGSVATGASFKAFMQVATGSGGSGTITDLSASTLSALSAGNSEGLSTSYTFNTAGSHSMRACADASSSAGGGTITESDEGDNCGGWTTISMSGAPMDGVCAATHYNCSVGTSTFNTSDASTYSWNCTGVNGGFSASCSEEKTIVASGTITATPPTCTIPAGSASCTSTIAWSTTNVAQPKVINLQTGETIGNRASGSKDVSGMTPTATRFVLETGTGTVLDSVDVQGACASGTTWNGSTCASTAVNGSCSATHYNCSAGSSTNNVSGSTSYTWSCTGTNGGSTASCSEAKAVNGSCSATHYGCSAGSSTSNSSGTTQYTWSCTGTSGGSTASCSEAKAVNGVCSATHYGCSAGSSTSNSSGTTQYTWSCTGTNGGATASCSEAKPASGNVSANPTTCTIPVGSGTCSSTIGWNTTNVAAATVKVQSGTTFASGTSGSKSAPWITTSVTTFTLSDDSTGSTLDSVNVQGTCASGSSWNGSTCAAPVTATLSASPTSVAYNGRSTLTWTSSGATSCTTSGNWSNSGNLSGSGLTDPLTQTATFTYQCTGPGGTSPLRSVTVTVGSAPVNGVCSATHYSCSAGTSANNSSGSTSYTWDCTGANGGTTASCSETKPVTATLSASPTSVAYNGRSTLTWTSSGATSCTTSGNWSNSGNLSGSGLTDPLTQTATFTYQCTGPGGTSPLRSVTVTVGSAPVNGVCSATHYSCSAGTSANNSSGSTSYTWDCLGTSGGSNAACSEQKQPTANLTASPSTVAAGSASTLSWSSTNATSCTGTGFSTGGATSGSVSTGALADTASYVVSCTNSGGSDVDGATVTVTHATATISASPPIVRTGDTTTISWSTSDVTSCDIVGPGLRSTLYNGSRSVAVTSQSTYTITCDAITPDSVTVNVTPRFQEF